MIIANVGHECLPIRPGDEKVFEHQILDSIAEANNGIYLATEEYFSANWPGTKSIYYAFQNKARATRFLLKVREQFPMDKLRLGQARYSRKTHEYVLVSLSKWPKEAGKDGASK